MESYSVNNYNNNELSDVQEYDDYSDPDPAGYFKNVSLRYFAAQPFQMIDHHVKFKELCLRNGNTEAHYIEGILRYFFFKDKQLVLHHLHQSAIESNPNINVIYLYGLLMLAEGHYITGKECLDKLEWATNRSTSNRCWERIKNSLNCFEIPMKKRYYVNWVNLKPRTNCDLDDISEVCIDCYYYKRLQQFVNFAQHKEDYNLWLVCVRKLESCGI